MVNNKIMSGDTLEDILTHLIECRALLRLLAGSAELDDIAANAVNGVCNLLDAIYLDCQAYTNAFYACYVKEKKNQV